MVNKTVAGQMTAFYRLSLLDDSGNGVLVSVNNLRALRFRGLIGKSAVPKLLSHLENAVTPPKNWKQRAIDNLKLSNSGSPYDLAEIVESLTELNGIKALTPRNRQTLDKARKFLVCEISAVIGESRNAAEGQIDRALENKRTLLKSNAACA